MKKDNYSLHSTLRGKYCFNRLPFVITCSGDALQQQPDQVLSGISIVTAISDVILIWGDTAEQHDTALHELLTRCQNIGIRLNREKIQYKQTKVKFYGHVLTNKGLQAHPSKIDAIVHMSPPPYFLGLVNYMARLHLRCQLYRVHYVII